ncbi:MAG: DNA primase [Bdellovibrionaceae bacterium]|nr:DNA primase [Pseudobdellovibrionaceae bacterium]
MAFDPDFIEKVRESSRLVDEISKYTELKRSGDRYTGLCPFPDHHEKTPSFSVSELKQVYYCFGCKKAGNIYNFLQALRGFSFPESVEYLAKKAGIAIPQQEGFKKNDSQEKKTRKQMFYKINTFAMEYFHNCLKNLTPDDPRLKYLAKRSLTPEIIKTFKLGIAPDSWDSLANEIGRNQVPLALSSELGLIKQRDTGGYFDLYRHRLMFPIFSHLGDCIGFGGRTLGDDKAKYINSPESEIFHKGQIFYGLHDTAKYIRSADQVIVVEGYMDFMALYSSGIKNVIAVLGTALTPQHAKVLKRYTKNILILFDGDSSGKTAAERSLPILLTENLLPRVVIIPNAQDPDDFLREHGVQVFQKLLNSSQDLFLHVFQEQFKDYSAQPSEKVQIMERILPSLALVQDRPLQKLYIEEMADTLRQDPSWIMGYLKSQGAGFQTVVPRVTPKPLTKTPSPSVLDNKGQILLDKVPKAELILINLAFMKPKFLVGLEERDMVKQFSSQESIALIEKLLSLYRQRANDFDKFTALMASEVEPSSAITQHLDRSWSQMDDPALEKFFNDCLKKVQEDYLKLQQQALKERMRISDPSERQQQLEQFMNIQKHIKALNNFNEPK